MKLWIKITIVTSLLVILTALTISIIVNEKIKTSLNESNFEWTDILSKSISQAIVSHTIEGNVRATQEILRRITKESQDLKYILVVDFSNNLFASTYDLPLLPKELKEIDHSKCVKNLLSHKKMHLTHHEHVVPVSLIGNNIVDYKNRLVENLDAHIHVGMDNEVLVSSVAAIKNYSIWVTVIISFISFIVAFIMGKRISQPIEALSQSVVDFGKTGKYKKPFVKTEDKDILKLVTSFDHMSEERIKHESEISKYKDNLENLVEERTKSLEEEIERHKETESELIKEKEISDVANRTKSDFLSHMSHELRTPLNAIMGFSQLLLLDDSDEIKESSREILKAGRHLLSLINDILDLSKIEAGKLELSIEDVNWNEVVDECHTLVASSMIEKNIRYFCDCEATYIIQADRVRLKQAVLNLMSNAVKYNQNSGSVVISFAIKDNVLRFIIKDTGKGIPDDKQRKVFVPFERLDMEQSAIDGVGIGLVITKALVESMHGQIGFKSELGLGSMFWMEFPLHRKELLEKTVQAEKNEVKVSSNKTQLLDIDGYKKVLYIEDNPSNMRVVQRVFDRYSNIELYPAYTPGEGFTILQNMIPDLILLDINLPEMDGYEVKQKLANTPEYAHIEVLGISANAMAHDIIKAKESGFVDYLPKPIDIEQLLAVMKKIFSNK